VTGASTDATDGSAVLAIVGDAEQAGTTSTIPGLKTTESVKATATVPGGPVIAADPRDDGLAMPLVAILLLVAVLVGAGLGYLIRSVRAPRPIALQRPQGLAASDSELVSSAIEVRDRVGNKVLADRLGAGLTSAGWITIDPAGDQFDPTYQSSVDREPTFNAALDGTVAAVERYGYRDQTGTVLRSPEVVVYRYERVPTGEAGR
jgi:hypothetical protein